MYSSPSRVGETSPREARNRANQSKVGGVTTPAAGQPGQLVGPEPEGLQGVEQPAQTGEDAEATSGRQARVNTSKVAGVSAMPACRAASSMVSS